MPGQFGGNHGNTQGTSKVNLRKAMGKLWGNHRQNQGELKETMNKKTKENYGEAIGQPKVNVRKTIGKPKEPICKLKQHLRKKHRTAMGKPWGP